MPLHALLKPVGRMLRGVRAGTDGLLWNHPSLSEVPDKLRVSSPAFAADGVIPAQFCGDGVDRSPPLAWSGVPAATQSLALIIEDADIPWRTPLVHGLIYLLAANVRALPEAALSRKPPADTPAFVWGRNSIGKRRYIAPAALPGHGVHRYYFQVLALDVTLKAACPVNRRDFLAAVDGHVIARGRLMGTFER